MPLNVSKIKSNNSGVEQPILEVGVYPVRTVQILDMGLQEQRPYKGKDKPPAYEVMMTYELLDVFMVDEDGNELEDKPRWIHESFPLHNLSADLAKSTKRYRVLDPDMVYDGDFTQLINIPVNLTVVHGFGKGKNTGKTYENVGDISPMRAKEAAKAPELKNKTKVFSLDEPDLEVFNSLPEWIQNKIKSNLEFKGSQLEELLGDSDNENSDDGEDEAW